MKYFLYVVTLAAQQAAACELTDVATLRNEVEAAFEVKSFAGFALRHGVSGPVWIRVEDEYDEKKPVRVIKFENILELSGWFHEMHHHDPNMIIPEKVSCSSSSCIYELPSQTLHHGIYLTGFESEKVASCLSLIRISIHWG